MIATETPVSEAVPPAVAPSNICGKCGDPIDTKGAPRWCKSCRANYQREYRDVEKQQWVDRGRVVEKEFLAVNFEAYKPHVQFSGKEIAHIIRTSSERPARR